VCFFFAFLLAKCRAVRLLFWSPEATSTAEESRMIIPERNQYFPFRIAQGSNIAFLFSSIFFFAE